MSLISAEQRPAWRPARPGELALVGVEVGAQQQVVEPDDAVERRADLVAHRGQELRLRLVDAAIARSRAAAS